MLQFYFLNVFLIILDKYCSFLLFCMTVCKTACHFFNNLDDLETMRIAGPFSAKTISSVGKVTY